MVPGAALAQAGAMTSTPPEAPPPPQDAASDPPLDHGPRVTTDQMRDLGRLRRSTTDRKIAGVAGGLGRHLDVDPLVLRVALVVLVLFGGAGLLLYGVCWLFLPEDGADRAMVNLDERSRTVALAIGGGLTALVLIGHTWGGLWFPWPLALVALVVLWLVTRNGSASPAPSPVPTSAYPAQGPPPTGPQQGWQPPPRPVDPRRRGPILFWITLALSALGVGVLGVVDLAGASLPSAAYPALVVATCGVMLLLGAFFGRAGGIIALGLVASLGLMVSAAADQWDGHHDRFTPTSVVAMGDHYDFSGGDRVIDLRDIADVSALDGRTLRIRGEFGRVRVYLPAGVGVDATTRITGFGHVDVLGDQQGGTDFTQTTTADPGSDVVMTLDVELGVGSIEVRQP